MLVEASTIAPSVDRIIWVLVGLNVAIMATVGTLVLVFAIKYREGIVWLLLWPLLYLVGR